LLLCLTLDVLPIPDEVDRRNGTLDLKERKVRVNAISPDVVSTPGVAPTSGYFKKTINGVTSTSGDY
jgi:hypothetical protein